MKRRSFLEKISKTAASTVALPYLLPSGRLFAPTGARKVNHVVFCLFAGGIRNLESMQKKEGNLMRNTLQGTESISEDIRLGMDTLPKILSKPLQTQGTLFKQFRFNSTRTIHYNAHAAAITGAYSPTISIMKPPKKPTIFEYFRKHTSPATAALKSWWISDQGGPFPYLHYSSHREYGPMYGANMIQPSSFFNEEVFRNPNQFNNFFEVSNAFSKIHTQELSQFFNSQFNQNKETRTSFKNPPEAEAQLQAFVQRMTSEMYSGVYSDPWGIGKATNLDIINAYTACNILKTFQPELLVVNLQNSDIGHGNFTKYCNYIRIADFALAKIWETIQSISEMAEDTILIVAPEFGRNQHPNTIMDEYGRKALDHTGDPMSQEIFCLIVGPSSIIQQGQIIDKVEGELIDIAPTIGHILGFKPHIPYGLLEGKVLHQAFV